MTDVIYLAAGQGKRAKLGYPKQFAYLGGKPIMVHALEVFQSMEQVKNIIVACIENDLRIRSIIAQYNITKAFPVAGGATRQGSVKAALKYVQSEHVLIHEAVRPFITEEFVRDIIAAGSDFVTPLKYAVSSVITLDGFFLPRDRVGEVQMPQKYRTDLLKTAHQSANYSDATDDAVLVMGATKGKPLIVPGLEENIKITTPLDLLIADAIYSKRHSNGE